MKLNHFVLSCNNDDGTLLYNSITRDACIIPVSRKKISSYLNALDPDESAYFRDNFFLEYSTQNEEINNVLESISRNIKYSKRFASLTIHLNYSCNLKCSYCYQNDIQNKKAMSHKVEAQLYEFFNKLMALNQLEKVDVAFIGGEPLLALDQLMRIAQRAKEAFKDSQIDFSLVTNGTLFTNQVANKLKSIKFKAIQITLDASRKIHDQQRIYKNGGHTYDDILKNLAILQEYHLPVAINCNLDENSYLQVNDLFNELSQHKISFPVIFSMIFDCESSCNRYISTISSRQRKIWLEVHKAAINYGYKYPPFYRLPHMVCGVERVNDFNISPDGKIYKCLSGMEKDVFFVTDIADFGTPKYFSRLSSFIEYKNRKEECLECKYRIVCGGWCRYKKMIYGEYCPFEEFEDNDLPLLEMSDWS